jgi:hypothetical protein
MWFVLSCDCESINYDRTMLWLEYLDLIFAPVTATVNHWVRAVVEGYSGSGACHEVTKANKH